MATVQPWIPMTEKIWTEEEKEAWLAEHGEGATHVVTFEPMYQIELCIPPWEHPERQIARSAVVWGQSMSQVFADGHDGASAVGGRASRGELAGDLQRGQAQASSAPGRLTTSL